MEPAMKPIILLPLAALTLAACGDGEAQRTESATRRIDGVTASVSATDVWCRPTPTGGRTGACYATLTAGQDDRLLAVATPAAASAQIHDMSTEGGMMKMAEMEGGLPLPAGQAVNLAPGGRHLMLIGLASPLTDGETTSLTLDFETAPDLTVQAAVRQPPTDAAH
jgi:copper(I)-binding protein